jgi:hypothetical protein
MSRQFELPTKLTQQSLFVAEVASFDAFDRQEFRQTLNPAAYCV